MKKTFERFSRIVALVLLVTFSFISCPVPSYDPFSPVETPLTLTPGVGTPCSFYLDSEGNYIETEAGGTGRTGLVVEDNKLAEGVLIYSDDTGYQDRVAFVYGDSIVSMFFKKGSNFPHRMVISDGSDVYYAYLSQYNEVSHNYYLTFLKDGLSYMMGQVVLNGNIFSLYQNDPELTTSQNRRMANMTIAMGVWGSIYATFEETQDFTIPLDRKITISSSAFRGIAKVFTYVAVASAVVATVVAPVVSFISPARLELAVVAIAVSEISTAIAVAAINIAILFEAKENKDDPQYGPFTVPADDDQPVLPDVYVSRVEPDGREYEINYNDNGKHEEFHIGANENLVVQFYIPGYDLSGITKEKLVIDMEDMGFMFIDEPSRKKGEDLSNRTHFRYPPADIVELPSPDHNKLRVKIMRSEITRCSGVPGTEYYGKLNFGFVFPLPDKNGNLLDLKVNGYDGGFDFRLSKYNERELRKDMVVIHFCLVDDCPDIKVTK